MRTVSEKYANSSKYYMDDTDFFSTETITVSIFFSDCSRLLNNYCLYRKQSENIRLRGTGALSEWPSRSNFLY